MELPVLIDSEGRRIVPRMLANFGIGTLAAVLGIAVLAGGALLLVRARPAARIRRVPHGRPAGCADRDCRRALTARSGSPSTMPTRSAACATAASSGCRRRAATSSRSDSRSRLTAAPGIPTSPRGPSRASAASARSRGLRSTPRSLGSDGWRSRPMALHGLPTPTGYGVTRLKDGVFTRHRDRSPRAADPTGWR